MMASRSNIAEVAGLLKNSPDISVVIKPGDKSVNRWTEKKVLEELQKLLEKEGLLIWNFPKSGGMVVELDFYKESGDA